MSHTFEGADAIDTSIRQAVRAFQCRVHRCVWSRKAAGDVSQSRHPVARRQLQLHGRCSVWLRKAERDKPQACTRAGSSVGQGPQPGAVATIARRLVLCHRPALVKPSRRRGVDPVLGMTGFRF